MTWNVVSASQVENYRRCPRYWYNRSILKFPEPEKPSQKLGKEVHSVLEAHLLTGRLDLQGGQGVDLEAIEIALKGLEFLPPRSPDMLIEHPFEMSTFPGGPKWIGYIDLFTPSLRRVTDHKTTSDFRYAKTDLELQQSVQMVSYARWAMLDERAQFTALAKPVAIQHIVYKTRKPYSARQVTTEVTPDQVQVIWAGVLDTVREMSYWAGTNHPTADLLPPNTESCGMYGGCTFKPQCGFGNPLVQLKKRGGQMGLLDEKLNARKKSAPEMPPPIALPIGTAYTISPVKPAEEEQVYPSIVPPDAPDRNEKVTMAQVEAEGGTKGRGRGRPKKSAVQAVSEVVIQTTEQAARTEAYAASLGISPPVAEEEPPKAPKTQMPVFVLCIDGFLLKDVDKREQTLSSDWLQPIIDTINNTQGVVDPRLLGFGEGAALVAGEIRKRVSNVPPVLLVDSMSPFAKELISALTPWASVIFKGAR